MKRDKVKGHLDLVLLGVLADRPGHGYAIISELRRRTDGVFDLPEGSVYPALHRLEVLGQVRSDWESVGGRRRRTYELTDSGREALTAGRRDWRALVAAVDAALQPRTGAGAAVPAIEGRLRPAGGAA